MPLATKLQIYFMQQWYALADPAMEDALHKVESMLRFAGLDLTDDAMAIETTMLKFRHLLEKHALTGQMMNIINDTLEQRGLVLKGGSRIGSKDGWNGFYGEPRRVSSAPFFPAKLEIEGDDAVVNALLRDSIEFKDTRDIR